MVFRLFCACVKFVYCSYVFCSPVVFVLWSILIIQFTNNFTILTGTYRPKLFSIQDGLCTIQFHWTVHIISLPPPTSPLCKSTAAFPRIWYLFLSIQYKEQHPSWSCSWWRVPSALVSLLMSVWGLNPNILHSRLHVDRYLKYEREVK